MKLKQKTMEFLNDMRQRWRLFFYIIVAVIAVILIGVPASLRFKVRPFQLMLNLAITKQGRIQGHQLRTDQPTDRPTDGQNLL